MRDFVKIVNPGSLPHGHSTARVFLQAQLTDGKLSFAGVVGPLKSGNAKGGCGQIILEFKDYDARGYYTLADIVNHTPSWDDALIRRWFDLWDRWHLNNMKAGSPAQESWLRANPLAPVLGSTYYESALAALTIAGINPDPADGYVYGSAWRTAVIPESVLQQIMAFPDTLVTPAWI